MAQMFGNLDVEAAAERLYWNGHRFDNAEDLVAHIAAEHDLSDDEVSQIDAEAVFEAYKKAAS